MKKEKQQQALRLTQELIVQWYMLKPEGIYSYLSENVTCIGAVNGQLWEGREKVISALESVVTKMHCSSLSNQIYIVSSSGRESCVVAGTIIVISEDKRVSNIQQRLSFVWLLEEGKLWITHMHVSYNAAAIEMEKTFPVKSSQNRYQYVPQKLSNERKTLTVCASNRVNYCIDCGEVEYLEAAKEYMIINYKGSEIKLHRRFSDVWKELFPNFILIHRSYCINPRFIWSVKKYQVQLLNSKILPLSRNRYAEVLEQLMG